MFPSFLSTALRVSGLALGVVVLGLNIWLLNVRETQQGLFFAVAGMAFGLSLILAAINLMRNRMVVWLITLGVFLVGVIVTMWMAIQAPNGRTSDTARVQNRYTDGGWHFRRLPLGNLLPEIDQFRFGFQVVPFVDHLFTHKQAATLTRLTSDIYKELNKDPDFHALGSVMPDAYDELWGMNFDRGHYFLCLPRNLDRSKPAPVLVFLHGSGGNFKAYTWLLSQLADELGVVVISPTYGMGNWVKKDTARIIDAALDDATQVVPLNRKQVHLMGLSNGGLGVCQGAVTLGKQLRSLIFLSPVLDLRIIGSAELADQWKDRPVLMVTGALDDRVPHEYVSSAADKLQLDQIKVSFKTIEDANHFMLFSHRQAVIRLISNWLQPQLAAPAP